MNESKAPSSPPPVVVEAFTSAAITALQELTQLEAFAEAAPDPSAMALTGNMVFAVVRLDRKIPGTMTLVVGSELASCLGSRYLPPESQLNEDIINDVLGEFANVIAGQAKTILKGTPYHFTMSIPVVTRADSTASPTSLPASKLVASIFTEHGRIQVFADLPSCPGE